MGSTVLLFHVVKLTGTYSIPKGYRHLCFVTKTDSLRFVVWNCDVCIREDNPFPEMFTFEFINLVDTESDNHDDIMINICLCQHSFTTVRGLLTDVLMRKETRRNNGVLVIIIIFVNHH